MSYHLLPSPNNSLTRDRGFNTNIDKCRIISLPKITDARGHLTFIEECKHIPFDIRRVYYIYGVPNGSKRGGHMNRLTEEVVIALNGQFTVRLREAGTERTFVLDRSDSGLYIPKGVWHQIEDLSLGSIVLVLASTFYSEKDQTRV